MPKFRIDPAMLAAAREARFSAFREVGEPLYAPPPEAVMAMLREAEAAEAGEDAFSVTIGDDEDDDFY